MNLLAEANPMLIWLNQTSVLIYKKAHRAYVRLK